ncbi:GNAT family N-acetyltransferase [Namhaeicola litoreus]|uniref:GNAT family N-acetyltransferase n=1 Tax=Namhaeicola litoreus TaxID=1052145 RepID=A0ABW3Y1T6_9FLAO
MMKLENDTVYLRALEPEDLDFLFEVENDISLWEISTTQKPFSRKDLKDYLANSDRDIYEVKQLRLVIERKSDNAPIGLIDLFDFDPFNKRAGLGILIKKEYQNKGFGSSSIKLLNEYAFRYLDLNQLYAHVPSNNKASISLFDHLGFLKTGNLKHWLKTEKGFTDVLVYQIFKNQ